MKPVSFEEFKKTLLIVLPCEESKEKFEKCQDWYTFETYALMYIQHQPGRSMETFSRLETLNMHHPIQKFFFKNMFKAVSSMLEDSESIAKLESKIDVLTYNIDQLGEQIKELEKFDLRNLVPDYNSNIFDPFNNFADREKLVDFIKAQYSTICPGQMKLVG